MKLGSFGFGDGFAMDCIRHHPVLPNRVFSRRAQVGGLCRDFRYRFCPLSSLWEFVVSGGDFGRFVSASRNSVPGGGAGKEALFGKMELLCRFGLRRGRKIEEIKCPICISDGARERALFG